MNSSFFLGSRGLQRVGTSLYKLFTPFTGPCGALRCAHGGFPPQNYTSQLKMPCFPASVLSKITELSELPPAISRFSAHEHQHSHNPVHLAAVNKALKGPGIALIDLKFADPNSDYLHDLVLGLVCHHNHNPPITHSSSRGWFWDVRPKGPAATHQARSESTLDFPWHTDCSYESRPPQFIALHVLHADRNGGGTLSALNASHILSKLGPEACESLSRPEFQIRVPPEFYNGIDTIVGSVISKSELHGQFHIRYRFDILQALSTTAEKALTQLNRLLSSDAHNSIRDIRIDLTAQDLPDNTIILLDNSRWLHARTEVKDRDRHLRRIRWGRRAFDQIQ